MKAAKTWCVAGLLVAFALSLPSCGKDEADGDAKGGSGMVLPNGGSAGGGMTGRGGSGGGSAGTTSAPATKLGRACKDDNDCSDTLAPGLKCVTATDAVLGDGAPPKGLCTADCTKNSECLDYGENSLCFLWDADSDAGYCIEGCKFGEVMLGETPKCHNRPEFACNSLFGDTGESCTTDAECQAGEPCLGGTCVALIPGCMPSCRGDIDCAKDWYCDQSRTLGGAGGGVCRKTKPTGKGLGEPCTVPGDDEPNEPDECQGFCSPDAATGNAGHCTTNCGLLNECGWNPTTQKFDGLCMYGTTLLEDEDLGDIGFCGLTCNCTDECNDDRLVCTVQYGELRDTFRGPGMCLAESDMTVLLDQCGAGGDGSGGAAGAGNGESGSGPTDGGAPSGEGGTGGAP
jgi:hypothetical protein